MPKLYAANHVSHATNLLAIHGVGQWGVLGAIHPTRSAVAIFSHQRMTSDASILHRKDRGARGGSIGRKQPLAGDPRKNALNKFPWPRIHGRTPSRVVPS